MYASGDVHVMNEPMIKVKVPLRRVAAIQLHTFLFIDRMNREGDFYHRAADRELPAYWLRGPYTLPGHRCPSVLPAYEAVFWEMCEPFLRLFMHRMPQI